ncbi:hypothetical protein [Candidatus Protochlamydia phocaeensis]|uniref:hypothetical protein n=1 Tax=Candidatus Protochlamydia phocaeensis TaxID=1414722 RepID=UPI0008395F75|nr:hypothetical protein [Candidatus Protochlamydia phocaeensis]
MNASFPPSSNLGMLLNQQMSNPGTFDYLYKHLGKDLVDNIPTVFLPPNIGGSDYPHPWQNAAELPADVVKGIFPITKRPFLAMRYIDTKVNAYALEVFFQRYSDEKPPSVNTYESPCWGDGPVEFLPLSDYSKNWTSSFIGSGSSICKDDMKKPTFNVVKHILSGSGLDLTEGRYLPLFKDRFFKS